MTTTTNDSGSETIRQALFARNRKFNLANLARDIGVQSAALEEFIHGRAKLAPDVLKKLAAYIWANSEYVPELDKLRPVNKEEPRSIGSGVPRAITETMRLPTYKAGPAPPRPGTPSPSKARRAGWVE